MVPNSLVQFGLLCDRVSVGRDQGISQRMSPLLDQIPPQRGDIRSPLQDFFKKGRQISEKPLSIPQQSQKKNRACGATCRGDIHDVPQNTGTSGVFHLRKPPPLRTKRKTIGGISYKLISFIREISKSRLGEF